MLPSRIASEPSPRYAQHSLQFVQTITAAINGSDKSTPSAVAIMPPVLISIVVSYYTGPHTFAAFKEYSIRICELLNSRQLQDAIACFNEPLRFVSCIARTKQLTREVVRRTRKYSASEDWDQFIATPDRRTCEKALRRRMESGSLDPSDTSPHEWPTPRVFFENNWYRYDPLRQIRRMIWSTTGKHKPVMGGPSNVDSAESAARHDSESMRKERWAFNRKALAEAVERCSSEEQLQQLQKCVKARPVLMELESVWSDLFNNCCDLMYLETWPDRESNRGFTFTQSSTHIWSQHFDSSGVGWILQFECVHKTGSILSGVMSDDRVWLDEWINISHPHMIAACKLAAPPLF